jgi:tetratricopeptide (TPR) repeat protein
MNRLPEALAAYRQTMSEVPTDRVARNGCASVLLLQGQYDAVLSLLPSLSPVTQQDWIDTHLRGMALLRGDRLDEAIDLFQLGVEQSPPSELDYFRAGLSLAQLRAGHLDQVAEQLERIESPRLLPARISFDCRSARDAVIGPAPSGRRAPWRIRVRRPVSS